MAEENSPARVLEPGAIDRTRRNIGAIDAEEAMQMQKKLGGEVLKERSVPVDTSNMPRRRTAVVSGSGVRAAGKTSSDISAKSAIAGSSMSNSSNSTSVSVKKIRTDDDLPEISPRDLKLMNKVMRSAVYNIKQDHGIFNFFYDNSAKNKEKVHKNIGEYVMKRHVDRMQGFISTIKTFIQIAPDTYKAKIVNETDLKFRFLRTVGNWTMKDIKVLAIDLSQMSANLTIPMLKPIIRAIYKPLLTIYYIGDQNVALLIKDIYNDLAAYSSSDKAKLQTLVKQATTDWLYVHDQIIKGCYPLLMRMCTSEFAPFPEFFKSRITDILKFVNLSKFDLLLPDKKKKEEKKAEEKKEDKKKDENRHIAGKKDEIVNMGLKILNQLFPQAGFNHLESRPDLYSYFQPIYNFEDGFNMLSPENPLQVTVVLIRILEDFLKGCRNIDFNIEGDEKLATLPDNLNEAMNDWSSYHEDLFDKKYGDYLREYVNTIYTQADYPNTKFGKETVNNILWRAKYYFLPHFKFSAPVLTKPINDNKYKPFFGRTDYIRTVLTALVTRIDQNAADKKPVLGILNPWDRYNFDLPNPISKRIDVLLGAKRSDDVTAATNANLIKYTLSIMAVLDWWVNNPQSPAYTADPTHIYRISAKDGGPEFSAPERTDQNQLFAEGVKKAIEAKKNK
ncbi:MAG: hypothetical protein K6B17_05160 [Treponema sp.]|nr:hypothetical protein [Treponema sp.]